MVASILLLCYNMSNGYCLLLLNAYWLLMFLFFYLSAHCQPRARCISTFLANPRQNVSFITFTHKKKLLKMRSLGKLEISSLAFAYCTYSKQSFHIIIIIHFQIIRVLFINFSRFYNSLLDHVRSSHRWDFNYSTL